MKVLLIKPREYAKVIDISPGLESLQNAVGGYIEAIYPYDDPVAVICNEEGKILGLELNRELRDESGRIYDILCGDILIVGLGDEDFCELSDELIEKYSKIMGNPRIFLQEKEDGPMIAVEMISAMEEA